MSTFRTLKFFAMVALVLLLANQHCFCLDSKPSTNASFRANGFSPAVATWYGEANGGGSGGACGFPDGDMMNPNYRGLTAAGNQFLFKSGKGCGGCYQVLCTDNPSCSRYPITVTITNECPGSCNNELVHFDLSGKAFGYLAKPGQDYSLRNAGRINIQYRRVACHYYSKIAFKIDSGSNPNYLAFAIEYVQGDGDIGSVHLFHSNWKAGPLVMQQSWGATWKVDIPAGIRGPYSVKVTTIESGNSFFARNVIPANWAPGQYYLVEL